jgi:LmbE family N-acetylglucosaminyl deacetylase
VAGGIGVSAFGSGLAALAIGAHPDDVEFGCFGTLQRFDRRRIVVMSAGEAGGPQELRRTEAVAAAKTIDAELTVLELVDTELSIPVVIDEIVAAVERHAPDVVFTLSALDTHQDHAAVGRAALVALRRFHGLVFAYPSPSLSPANFAPQTFMEVDEISQARKMKALSAHRSQAHRHYLGDDYLETVSRYWAHQAGGSFQWCEPFELVRWAGAR